MGTSTLGLRIRNAVASRNATAKPSLSRPKKLTIGEKRLYSAASLSKFPDEGVDFNLVLLRGGVFGGNFLIPLT
jgi:hypothetical protein